METPSSSAASVSEYCDFPVLDSWSTRPRFVLICIVEVGNFSPTRAERLFTLRFVLTYQRTKDLAARGPHPFARRVFAIEWLATYETPSARRSGALFCG